MTTHLKITSANLFANKVNQNKIREVSVQSTQVESPNVPFCHRLCHLEFLRYQTIYLTCMLPYVLQKRTGWQAKRLNYVSWLEGRLHIVASIKLQETPIDKSIHIYRYFFSKRWEVSAWRETKTRREEALIDFIHSSKYLSHLPVHIALHFGAVVSTCTRGGVSSLYHCRWRCQLLG